MPDLYITEEDLQDALERGDLSFEEYEQLIEHFRSREASDDQQLDVARVPGDSLAVQLAPAATPARRAPHVYYQATVGLRGNTGESQILGIEPRVGQQTFRWEIARGGEDWYVRTARASLVYRSSLLSLGAFDTRWTGGLLIGAAPAFLKSPAAFSPTVSQPHRGRLNGARYEWRNGSKAVTALGSERHDTAFVHQAYGLRAANEYNGVAIDAAYLHQTLVRRRASGRFEIDLWGIGARKRSRGMSTDVDMATNLRNFAFQGSVISRRRSNYDWRLTAWQVSSGFRHPLLAAIGEPDREAVWYPELCLSISSPSTGERGIESSVRFGGLGSTNSVAFTYWRENPSRPASLKGKLSREHAWRHWNFDGEYYLHTRSDELERSFRHEISARIERGAIFASAKYRLIDGDWSRFGSHGMRAQAGWRSKSASGAVGGLTASVAYDDFDWAKDNSAFWTLRVDQELSIRNRGGLGVHIRWRTAYARTPPSLALRVVTSMFL